ncbi:MAG: ABC transporter ATP-binding protein [Synergistaceae bacterium]|jgi:oligopeptide/dipeptide ABC transporter ATP-binding protein|nr:ABC transporter ATP-binding protein [Synergistaceae bacterium]
MAYFEINRLVVKRRSFDGAQTILDIDKLHIDKGEIFGLVGESGQGKTVAALTILKLLRCPPGVIESGEVILDGVNLTNLSNKQMKRQIRGKKIAMIFQDPMSCLNPVFTVKECMLDVLAENRRGLRKAAAVREALRLLEEVKLPDPSSILGKYPHQLSGGQRQRVIIALALCCGAEFLIADEPTRNLDVTIQASILKLLWELKEKHGLTILFIANNLGLISAFCDRVGVLQNGKIIEEGITEQVINQPENEYTRLLLDACAIVTKAEPAENDEGVLLKVENLKKYFVINDDIRKIKHQSLRAVDDVSFELMKGETLGIVGESGCGKSTLVNTILGLYSPTSGKVHFEGRDVYGKHQKKADNAFKKNVQIVFQDPFWSLNPRWLVKDIVAEPLDVYEKPGEQKRLARVVELLAMVGLEKEDCFKYPHEFSGGQRQRIAIARSLASNPKLVVLDEPTSSIDVLSQNQILDLIKDLKKQFGLTNILISHDLAVVHELSNVIAVMYMGKIVEMGPAEAIFTAPGHPYTKALFDAIPQIGAAGMESMRTLDGQIPSSITPPSGCAFHTRCPHVTEPCKQAVPPAISVGDKHYVRCINL